MMQVSPTPPTTTPDQDFDQVRLQLDRYVRARDGMEPWAKEARECVKFREGNQWEEADIKKLDEAGRPALTLNKINPLVRLVVGYFRQNRSDIRYLPGNDDSSLPGVAEVLSNIAKQIDEANQAPWIHAETFADGIVTGRGFMDLRMDYESNLMGNVSQTCLDPFSVYIDPEADTYAPEGWNFVITGRWMSPEDIEALYGKRAANTLRLYLGDSTGFPVTEDTSSWESYWRPEQGFGLDQETIRDLDTGVTGLSTSAYEMINRQRRLIRVLECQHRKMMKVRYFIDLETGQKKLIPEGFPDEKVQRILQWTEQNNQPVGIADGIEKVVYFTTTAADIILYNRPSPYSDFTIIPFFPYFRRGKTTGMVYDLLDPQREINKRRSANLHITMTTANSGWIFEEGSLREEVQEALEDEGSKPGINIPFRQGFQTPSRITPAHPPTALKQLEDAAVSDLKEIAGINDSALGQMDKVQSGRAIMARQKQAIIGTEGYFDNWQRTLELKGRRMLECIQRYYNVPRVIRVRGKGDMGQDQQIAINKKNEAGQVVNDISLGSYAVAVDTSPMSESFQQAQFEDAMRLAEAGMPIPPEILIELSSVPREDEILAKMREQKEQGPPPDPRAQAEQAKLQAQAQIEQAKLQAQMQIKQGEMQLKYAELQAQAQGKQMQAQSDARMKVAEIQLAQAKAAEDAEARQREISSKEMIEARKDATHRAEIAINADIKMDEVNQKAEAERNKLKTQPTAGIKTRTQDITEKNESLEKTVKQLQERQKRAEEQRRIKKPPKKKTVTFTRDKDGKISGAEVIEE